MVAVLDETGVLALVSTVPFSSATSAIIGLKVATGLACINWIAFAATLFICNMC